MESRETRNDERRDESRRCRHECPRHESANLYSAIIFPENLPARRPPSCMNDTERRRTIDLALVQMEKQFGKGTILRLGSKAVVPVSVISSGSISIDNALGV